jgi:hypothetical protein
MEPHRWVTGTAALTGTVLGVGNLGDASAVVSKVAQLAT